MMEPQLVITVGLSDAFTCNVAGELAVVCEVVDRFYAQLCQTLTCVPVEVVQRPSWPAVPNMALLNYAVRLAGFQLATTGPTSAVLVEIVRFFAVVNVVLREQARLAAVACVPPPIHAVAIGVDVTGRSH